MKKSISATLLLAIVLSLCLQVSESAKANWLPTPFVPEPTAYVEYPTNRAAYNRSRISLTLSVTHVSVSYGNAVEIKGFGLFLDEEPLAGLHPTYLSSVYSDGMRTSKWSVALPTLSDGFHTLFFKVTVGVEKEIQWGTPQRNEGTSNVVCFTIDTIPPTSFQILTENKTYNSNFVPLKMFANESNLQIVYILDNDTKTTIIQNTTLRDLKEGSHAIVAYAKDAAENLVIRRITFSVDTILPTISALSIEGKVCNSSDVRLEFNANEKLSSMAYILDNNAETMIDGNTTIKGISEGTHKITLSLNDTAQNKAVYGPVTFIVDTCAPYIHILHPENETYVTNTIPFEFILTEPSNLSYCLDGKEFKPLNGNCTLNELTEGTHTLTVLVFDGAGNTALSNTVAFEVKGPKLSVVPIELGWAFLVIAVVVAAVFTFVLFVRRKRQKQN